MNWEKSLSAAIAVAAKSTKKGRMSRARKRGPGGITRPSIETAMTEGKRGEVGEKSSMSRIINLSAGKARRPSVEMFSAD